MLKKNISETLAQYQPSPTNKTVSLQKSEKYDTHYCASWDLNGSFNDIWILMGLTVNFGILNRIYCDGFGF